MPSRNELPPVGGNKEQKVEKQIITLEADKPFDVEITGPRDAETAVIMVHGFGVKRDSRGLFTDIEDRISDRALSVRGDFSEVHGDSTTAVPLQLQAERLKSINAHLDTKVHSKKKVYIGHSQGAIPIARANITGAKIILLAPPIDSPYENFVKTPGWKKPGSVLDVDGKSRLQRSDLTVEVGKEFWDDFKQVDAIALYKKLAEQNDVEIVFADADQVLGHQTAPEGLQAISIPGANHDFQNEARSVLVESLDKALG